MTANGSRALRMCPSGLAPERALRKAHVERSSAQRNEVQSCAESAAFVEPQCSAAELRFNVIGI